MTKKSASRIMRDAEKAAAAQHLKDNTIWDDLNGTYSACAQALGQHAGIAMMLNRKEVFPYLKDHKALVANIGTLASDLRALNEELKQIQAQHKGKAGGSENPDDVILSIQIFEQYHLFLERHQAVVMPVALHILEEFGAAETAYAQALQAAQAPSDIEKAQDPNNHDVIDVEYKMDDSAQANVH